MVANFSFQSPKKKTSAGHLWQDFLETQICRIVAQQIQGSLANFLFDLEGHRMLLNMYVDDMTLSGASRLHAKFWQQFSELIKIEGPQTLLPNNAVLISSRLHMNLKPHKV